MGIRKTTTEVVVVTGEAGVWLERSANALNSQGFSNVQMNPQLGQVYGDHKKVKSTLYGDVLITVSPEGPNTRLTIAATANIDNVYALGRSPGRKLIWMVKTGLGQFSEAPVTAAGWYSDPEGQEGLRYWDGTVWTEHRHDQATVAIPVPQSSESVSDQIAESGPLSSELIKLAQLRDAGVLSDDEFAAAKRKLLS